MILVNCFALTHAISYNFPPLIWPFEFFQIAFDSKVSDLDYLKSLSGQGDDQGQKEDKSDDEGADEKTEVKKKEKKKKEAKNEDYFTVKLTGLPYKAKKKDVKKFLQPLKAKSIRVPRQIKGIAYAGFGAEKDMKKALNKNKGFIGSNQIAVMVYVNNNPSKMSAQQQETHARWVNLL